MRDKEFHSKCEKLLKDLVKLNCKNMLIDKSFIYFEVGKKAIHSIISNYFKKFNYKITFRHLPGSSKARVIIVENISSLLAKVKNLINKNAKLN